MADTETLIGSRDKGTRGSANVCGERGPCNRRPSSLASS